MKDNRADTLGFFLQTSPTRIDNTKSETSYYGVHILAPLASALQDTGIFLGSCLEENTVLAQLVNNFLGLLAISRFDIAILRACLSVIATPVLFCRWKVKLI